MKRLFAFLIGCLAFASCNKDDLDPVTGYNSEIKIENISLTGVGPDVTRVVGFLTREYIIETDSVPVTENYIDSFEVNSNGYNQQFHFNTSSKAIKCNIQVKFRIFGATASSVSAASCLYYKDKAIVFAATPLEISGTGSDFYSAIHTVTF